MVEDTLYTFRTLCPIDCLYFEWVSQTVNEGVCTYLLHTWWRWSWKGYTPLLLHFFHIRCLSILALNEFNEGASTMLFSKAFQQSTILWEKKLFLTNIRDRLLNSFQEFPRSVCNFAFSKKILEFVVCQSVSKFSRPTRAL